MFDEIIQYYYGLSNNNQENSIKNIIKERELRKKINEREKRKLTRTTASPKRSFIIIESPMPQENETVYKARTPSQAASKALTDLHRHYDIPGENYFIRFSLKEVTPGSKNKHYIRSGIRVKLNKPVRVNRKGTKTTTHRYKNIISNFDPYNMNM